MDVTDPGSILNYKKELDEYVNFEMGYVRQEPYIYTPTPLVVYTADQKVELSEKEKAELDRVIGLCAQNGITPVFVKTPCILDQENTNKLQAVWDYLDTKNVRHIDYLQKAEELKWYMNMDGDTWHNNSWGAEIITKDGRKLLSDECEPRGEAHENIQVDWLQDKFRRITGPILTAEGQEKVLDLICRDEDLPLRAIVDEVNKAEYWKDRN